MYTHITHALCYAFMCIMLYNSTYFNVFLNHWSCVTRNRRPRQRVGISSGWSETPPYPYVFVFVNDIVFTSMGVNIPTSYYAMPKSRARAYAGNDCFLFLLLWSSLSRVPPSNNYNNNNNTLFACMWRYIKYLRDKNPDMHNQL